MIMKASIRIVFLVGVVMCVYSLYKLIPYALDGEQLINKPALKYHFIYLIGAFLALIAPIQSKFLTKE